MIAPRQIECSFLIPVRRDADLSDGSPHQTDLWEWLDDELYNRFGGATEAPGLYGGFYRDPDTGKRVADQSHKFIVAVSVHQLHELRAFLVEVCGLFQQKCIYLSVAGEVEFIKATPS